MLTKNYVLDTLVTLVIPANLTTGLQLIALFHLYFGLDLGSIQLTTTSFTFVFLLSHSIANYFLLPLNYYDNYILLFYLIFKIKSPQI